MLYIKEHIAYILVVGGMRKDGETSSKQGIASLNSVFMKDAVYKELT